MQLDRDSDPWLDNTYNGFANSAAPLAFEPRPREPRSRPGSGLGPRRGLALAGLAVVLAAGAFAAIPLLQRLNSHPFPDAAPAAPAPAAHPAAEAITPPAAVPEEPPAASPAPASPGATPAVAVSELPPSRAAPEAPRPAANLAAPPPRAEAAPRPRRHAAAPARASAPRGGPAAAAATADANLAETLAPSSTLSAQAGGLSPAR